MSDISGEDGRIRFARVGEGVGCSRPECICHDITKSLVCDEWMGWGGEFCPRCGWNRAAHPTIGAAVGIGSNETA